MERTLILLKPDALEKGIVGELVTRFERRGLKLQAMKMLWLEREEAERHYAEHRGRPFFESLIGYITRGPLVAMVLAGDNVVGMVRAMVGETDPQEAAPGTIRGDFSRAMPENTIHASDAPGTAEREIGIFFDEDEIFEY